MYLVKVQLKVLLLNEYITKLSTGYNYIFTYLSRFGTFSVLLNIKLIVVYVCKGLKPIRFL